MLNTVVWTKRSLRNGFTGVGALILALAVPAARAEVSVSGSAEVSGSSGSIAGNTMVRYSAGVMDVIKMNDAGVDAGVIKAFLRKSATPFNPSAEEIILLKQRNVPDDVITALVDRGAEVRAQLAQAYPNNPPAPQPQQQTYAQQPATAPLTPAPVYDYGYSVAPTYSYSSPYYYDYSYPYYNSYYYGGGPVFSFGFSPFRHYGGFGHGFSGGFHAFGGFHGGTSHSWGGGGSHWSGGGSHSSGGFHGGSSGGHSGHH
jgi:hypothetical protein